MLQHLQHLSTNTDGRYASDEELSFFQDYLKTVRPRFLLYQKIQKLEPQIIQQVLTQLKATRPHLLRMGTTDMTDKWQRDTVRTLRYVATALLIDDPEILQDRMLLWFATVMKSFRAEQTCQETYTIMQSVVRQLLTLEEADLLCPLLEISRTTLGNLENPSPKP